MRTAVQGMRGYVLHSKTIIWLGSTSLSQEKDSKTKLLKCNRVKGNGKDNNYALFDNDSYQHCTVSHFNTRLLNQRTNGPVNAHLISWPSKAQNIQKLKNIW